MPEPRRAILHVDMDAFFASIEQRDAPELRGKPVLVGGAGSRGVVAAASYEARTYGCHSAQPMSIARRRCPDAVIVRPRRDAYVEASRQAFEIFERYTPAVQPLSIDEAFLDVTGSQRAHGPAIDIAERIRADIVREIRVTASVGVAPNKFLAKLASDMDKPDGLTVIEPDRVLETLAPLPVKRMWGVGPQMEKKLLNFGVRTFGDLQTMPTEVLTARFGPHAARLTSLARGEDERPVTPDRTAKSISQERTFGSDLTEPADVEAMLMQEVEQVARRLRRHELHARTVTLKIRFGDFETITRSTTLDEPTDRTDELWAAGRTVFRRWSERAFQPVRLIGFGASQLSHGEMQLGLFTAETDGQRRRLDAVTDVIEAKFGRGSIGRAAGLPPEPGGRADQ